MLRLDSHPFALISAKPEKGLPASPKLKYRLLLHVL